MADGNRAAGKLVNWVSLNAQHESIRLIACKKAWGVVRLEMLGAVHLSVEQRAGLARLGFVKPRFGSEHQLVRRELVITLADLRRVFPNAAQVEMPQEHAAHAAPIRTSSRDASAEDYQEKVEELAAKVVGKNSAGETVLEGDEGRYVVREDGRAQIEGDAGDAKFLRAGNDNDMADCADAFVAEIAAGRVMRRDDLRDFASRVTGIAPAEVVKTPEMRRVQEAVEAALVRRLSAFAAEGGRSSEAIHAMAVRLLEGQPAFEARTSSSVMLQQYSSPLPMGVAAQVALGDMRGRTVLEPTIGNGSLVSTISGARIVGVDLDNARLANVRRARSDVIAEVGDATVIDFTKFNDGLRFDAVIANPPFGKLESSIMMNGLKVNRLDHLVLLKALASRADDGVGVFIIGADSYIDTRAGKVSGASRYLFNWLADHYQIDVVEIPGRTYAKQGATFPVRMVVVGKRGAGFDQVPDELPLLDEPQGLLAWASRMRSKYAGNLVAVSDEETKPLELAHDESSSMDLAEEVDTAARQTQGPNISESAENSYQSPYMALSQVAEATAMIPRNLQTPTMLALQEVEREHGDLDGFVADQLAWSVSELGTYLSPEQVDSVALNIHAVLRSDGVAGFLMGDQTGMGKGRHIAAMARWHRLQGRQCVFLSETPTLFTDFWRDLKGINSESLFRPLIINAGVSIIDDVTGAKLVPPTATSVVQRALSSGAIPDEYDLVLATYSQFNRDRSAATSAKSAWITTATTGAALLLDESHNAAGSSNTNANITLAVDAAYSVTYSSATSIKEPKNLSVYSRLFPPTIDLAGLPETLQTGGEVLQEVLTGMLARDGVFVRREHDLSQLTFKVVEDNDLRQRRNRELSDHLAQILEAMNYLAGDINRQVSEYNKEVKELIEAMPESERSGNRMGATSINYFSRLFNIYRQFLLALQVDLAAERAVGALAAGQKPVIVLESTMEQLLKDVIAVHSSDEMLPDEDGLSAEGAATLVNKGGLDLGEGLTFRHVLDRTLDRLSYIQTTDRYGARGKQALASEESANAIRRIRELIAEMPDLPISPIDSVREAIRSSGYVCSELSGRKLSIELRGSSWYADIRPEQAKAEIVRGFNIGREDAVILSRAGSTGVSLHASSQFPDQRQRVMIELQMALDITKRMQFFGRVNRRGQVNSPIIESLSTGLVGQARPIAMANAKLRKLSANTTANQDNASLDANVPDFLNQVGDQVASRYLESNPGIAMRLDIDMESDQERESSYFINKLTSRLVMLSVEEQEGIYAALTSEYVRLIAEMDEKGINPLKSKEIDIRAIEVSREIYEDGDAHSASVFNQPVYLKKIQHEVMRDPLRAPTVKAMIEAGRTVSISSGEDGAFDEVPLAKIIARIADQLDRELPRDLRKALPEKFKTVDDALDSTETNAVKKTQERYNFILRTLESVELGRAAWFTDNSGERALGLVCSIRLPQKKSQAAQLSAYTLRFAVPGEDRVIERSFFGLREDAEFRVLPAKVMVESLYEKLDEAPAGVEIQERLVLDGNLFKAAQLAAQNKMGASVVYTDREGMRHRGVLLSRWVDMKCLNELPVRLETPAMVKALLERDPRLILTDSSGDEGSSEHHTILSTNEGTVSIQCPGTKARGGSVFANKDLIAVVGEFSGSRSSMHARFSTEKLISALEVLYRDGKSFYAPARLRGAVNELKSSTYNNDSSMRKYDESEIPTGPYAR
ncbi:strawberry notch C-terminal domain-containing protein [Xanthomonas euvesicatoria]